MTPIEQALKLADMGFYVVAGFPAGKSERAIITGTQDGTRDPEKLKTWFAEIPDRNVHINLKNSNLICLDLDKHHEGQDGLKMLAELKNRYSDGQPLPRTYGEFTPKNGLHLFYRVPAELFDTSKPNNGVMAELADGVEVKTGFTTIYPSKRTDGAYSPCYANADGEPLSLADVADCPQWLLKLLPYKEQHKPLSGRYRASNGQPTYTVKMLNLLANGAQQGNRNIEFNRFLFYLRKIGLPPTESKTLLLDLNNRTSPPLDDKELATIWRSVWK
ncbi:hypothetical protein BM86_11790 [Bacillus thuringiensis]|nr:hypothetical protein [Bacillus thuringiensis]